MTTIDIPEKQHTKLKKEALKRKIHLKDLVKEKLSVLAIVTLFTMAIGFSAAYAFDETVQLPSEDYTDKNCRAVIWETSDWEFSCTWQYGEKSSFIDTRNGKVIPLDETSETPFSDLMRDITLYLDEQIELNENESVTPSEEEDELTTSELEELAPEVRKALSDLKICQLGVDEWKAIVPGYNLTTSEFAPIFKHLDEDQQLKKLALEFEECRGQTEYSWLSQQYNNTYAADLEAKNRALENMGLDETRIFEEQRTATQEELDAEADVEFPSWVKDPYADCQSDVTIEYKGETRNICDNVGNPEPIINDIASYNEYISFKAGQILTDQDYENLLTDLKKVQCDIYGKQYEYKIRTDIHGEKDYSDFPEWLNHCHE